MTRSSRSVMSPTSHATTKPIVTIRIIARTFGSTANTCWLSSSSGLSRALSQNSLMAASVIRHESPARVGRLHLFPPFDQVGLFLFERLTELFDAPLRLGCRQPLGFQDERRGPAQVQRGQGLQ